MLPGEYNGWDSDETYFNTTLFGILNQKGQGVSFDGNEMGAAYSLRKQLEAYKQQGVPVVDPSKENDLLRTSPVELELARIKTQTKILKLWLESRENSDTE